MLRVFDGIGKVPDQIDPSTAFSQQTSWFPSPEFIQAALSFVEDIGTDRGFLNVKSDYNLFRWVALVAVDHSVVKRF